MRFALKLLLITGLALIILIPAGLVIMIVDPHPRVSTTSQTDPADLAKARKLMAPLKSGDPDQMPLTSLTLPEKELNTLVEYGLDYLINRNRAAVKVRLLPDTAMVYATIRVPDIVLGKWINVAMAVRPRPGALDIVQAWVGRLRLPGPAIQWIANHVHARLMNMPRYARAISLMEQIQTVSISRGQAFLQFQWDPLMLATLTGEVKNQMFSLTHQKRLIEYHNYLVEQASKIEWKQDSLVTVIRPLFNRAVENTALSEDPVAENTAVLQVLAAHVLEQDISGFLAPDLRSRLSKSRPAVVFQLHGREDLARHFLSSAAITVSTSSKLARAMGMAKEMEDAHTDSGYSFVDISANEAGIRLGEFAVSGSSSARRIQQRLKDVSHENAFIPEIDGLPENMTAEAFQNRFQTPRSAAFSQIIQKIEFRINACPIYQN